MSASLDAARAQLGWTAHEGLHVVEASHLRRFAQAVGDPDPRWREQAPPTFTAVFLPEPPPLPPGFDFGRGWLNGGDAWEYCEPIRAGDSLTSATILTDAYEKHGNSGHMIFLVFETDFHNQHGRLTVKHRGTRIRR